MNDRFKFRAWYCDKDDENDSNNNKMFYNAQDTYDCLGGNPPLRASSFGDIIDDECWIVEQCTGLKDKNGKLIYENDYVKYNENVYKVFWNKTKISLENILNNDIIDIEEFDYMEIIGNEHEKRNIGKI